MGPVRLAARTFFNAHYQGKYRNRADKSTVVVAAALVSEILETDSERSCSVWRDGVSRHQVVRRRRAVGASVVRALTVLG